MESAGAIIVPILAVVATVFVLFRGGAVPESWRWRFYWRFGYRWVSWWVQHGLGGWASTPLPAQFKSLDEVAGLLSRARYRHDRTDYSQTPERSWYLLRRNPEVHLGDCDDFARFWCAAAKRCPEVERAYWVCVWTPRVAHATGVARLKDGAWVTLDYDDIGPRRSTMLEAVEALFAESYGGADIEAWVLLDRDARCLEVEG